MKNFDDIIAMIVLGTASIFILFSTLCLAIICGKFALDSLGV